jgi:hypothetical protein
MGSARAKGFKDKEKRRRRWPDREFTWWAELITMLNVILK